MITNQQVFAYIKTKFPYSNEVILEGFEKCKIFAIASEGNDAESQLLDRILV
mgnify:FL=1|jgi:hypothetical protein